MESLASPNRLSRYSVLLLWALLILTAVFELHKLDVHRFGLDDFITEAITLVVGIVAALLADYAWKQSASTTTKLAEASMIATEAKAKFLEIYKEHLIGELKRHGKRSQIKLILSTPAYGFGVVGPDGFKEFYKAFAGLDRECEVEIVLFDPDAHFDYWSNVLIWAVKHGDHPEKTVKGFADAIMYVMNKVRDPSAFETKIWLSREAPVRLFFFKGDDDSSTRLFVVLTDQFDLPKDQYDESFKARSIPIILEQRREFIGGDQSYFERIKQCPYTSLQGNQAAICPKSESDRDEMKALQEDFILGRTEKDRFRPKEFSEEIATVVRQMQFMGNKKNLLEQMVNSTLEYFRYCLCELNLRVTPKQGARLRAAIERLKLPNDTKAALLAELHNVDQDELKAAEQELARETQNNRLISCLYFILCSGFSESQYPTARHKKEEILLPQTYKEQGK